MRKAISAMYNWAIDREIVSENPAAKIRRINTKSDGFYTCTIDDIRKYLGHHVPGTMARRAMILALCTGARREDIRTLGTFNETMRDGVKWLRWRQNKAPHSWVEIPMLQLLQAELSEHPGGNYIVNQNGRPHTHASIGNMIKKWFDQAEVKGSLHGVRKGLASILPEMGASNYEIDVLLGHELGSKESMVYVKKAQRANLAGSLADKIDDIGF